MFSLDVHSFARMSQPKKIQRSGEKVPERKILKSCKDKNLYKVKDCWLR